MSQGVVTNYFTKKRKGSYIQPSKRLKLSDQAPKENKQSKSPLLAQPEKIVREIRSARKQITKRTSKSSTRCKAVETSKKASVNIDALTPLEAYFRQNLDSTPGTNEDLTLRLSPTSSDSGSSWSEVITAACDDHDVPRTPKRHGEENNGARKGKRGRVTPKKLGFDYQVSEDEKTGRLKPETDFKQIHPRRRNARKKLLCGEIKEGNSSVDNAQEPQTFTSDQISEQSHLIYSAKELMIGDQETLKQPEELARKMKTKFGKDDGPGTSAGMQKTANLADKLQAKKKESPELLKKAIKNSGNLKDLQQTLMKIRQQKKKHKEKEKPLRQSKKVEETPQKEASHGGKREFAYETLHNLAQDIPKELQLPFKYKILEEFFRCTDTVVSMLFNRSQVTTWTKLQKSVKEMVRKNFELTHLGQIKSVFPQAYRYQQEKGIIGYTDHIRPSDYQLTVEPILDEAESKSFGEDQHKLTSGTLVKRRRHFLWQLINIVKEHHKKFLSSLSPPIEVPDDKKIRRWHPQFPLDRVPDVEVADLPKPPDHDKVKCHSAKEVLDKARSKFTKKAVDALKKVAGRASLTPEKPRVREENNNMTPIKCKDTSPNSSSALKGVSQSLLAKIRAKEADKKLKSMVRSDGDAKTLQQLVKLPDVARALRMLYVSEKKAALPIDYICEKLVKCCTGIMTPTVVEDHVLLLIQHTPTWLNQTKVRNMNYVKMNKAKEMAGILQCLQEKIKEAENA